MDRNREARRGTIAAPNGLTRRRHRSCSLRDSPEEDGAVELQETGRLRDRKKERDRDRDRERDIRDRDRFSRNKRRRGDRLIHSSNREDGGDDSSEESVNDDEEDEDDDGGGGGGVTVRMLPPNPASLSSSSLTNHRKSLPQAKSSKASPDWKAADEMIGVLVPRRQRSASTKRTHECWTSSGGVIGERIPRQASTSPVRPTLSGIGTGAGPSPSPASPSSSNASVRKKIKPNGPKLRPPKSYSKSYSSAQDEIEIEIAEVLYGMMRQPQGPLKQEVVANVSSKFDCTEANKPSTDSKSRVSSPISNSESGALPQNSTSSINHISAVAPKRKKPRPVKYDEENSSISNVRNSPISSSAKPENDQPSKIETSSPNFEKNSGSAAENGDIDGDMVNSRAAPSPSDARPDPVKLETSGLSDSKPVMEESEDGDVGVSKDKPQSPKKESPVLKRDDCHEEVKATKANQTISESESPREEKFQIDLMAPPPPPPPMRSSLERDSNSFVDMKLKPVELDAETEVKPTVQDDDKASKERKEEALTKEAEEAGLEKPVIHKERNIDIQLDLEKADRDSANGSFGGKNLSQHVQRQQQQSNIEKSSQSSSLPLPMSVPSWPGGLAAMGYMPPLQGVLSMDGSTVSSAALPVQPQHLLFNQPRPKRCATHCYIARNICYHQQIARMNPFWPAAAGSGSLYGAKPCNLNAVPSTDLHSNIPGRGASSSQDKGHGLAIFPGNIGKDKGSQAVNGVDGAQRKQILLQQALPAGAPSNILHGPAFIFPINQPQAAAAASARPGSVKSTATAGSVTSSCASNTVSGSVSATGAVTAPTMSFSYPNVPGSETQYLAILQNNAYPFPIPAHVGAPPALRGSHPQALPFFNGSFYSQMIHPSQLQQQQQQQQQQLPSQSQQGQQGHHNASNSGGSSSSQKHLQNQQQRSAGNGSNGSGGNLQGFPASKNQTSQQLQLQQQHQRQQLQNHHASHQARQIDSEMNGEDCPANVDNRHSRATVNVYGQNFAMPMQPPSFALLSPSSIAGASSATNAGNVHGEKKQQSQQAGSKVGVEASPAFALSFASINGATASPGFDLSSLAHNHPIIQSHGYQMMAAAAAAQAAQQKKNSHASEEGKTGAVGSSNMEEERKASAHGKIPATMGQSIAFSRSDITEPPSISTVAGNSVIDCSVRSLNLASAPGRPSGSIVPPAISSVNAAASHQQLHRNQQQQMIQLQKQQQFASAAAAAAQTKASTSNGTVYSDHLPSSSIAAKFPNSVSAFPQSLAQSSSSPAQSPQWKNSVRVTSSQAPSLASVSVKSLPQQHTRSPQIHTQIAFAANPKSSSAQQVQPSASNQSPSPVMVGSPTTSSVSKSAGGSPRTTSTSTSNKVGQSSSLSSQQGKNSQSVPSRKSSPVGGRNMPSVLGSPHVTVSSNTGTKSQLPQQQQQQSQISKQSLQQAQLFFSNAYLQAQASQASSPNVAASAASGYYLQRRRPEQQHPLGSSGTSSKGMFSAVTLSNSSTSDSAKVGVSASSNMKGGSYTPQFAQFAAVAQSSGNQHQLVPAGFPYVHAVPTAVQVKPAEQKQPAGE